jgi:hypothetical protein
VATSDTDLKVVDGHMLNALHAPSVAGRLLEVAADRRVQLSQFNRGPAAAFWLLPPSRSAG